MDDAPAPAAPPHPPPTDLPPRDLPRDLPPRDPPVRLPVAVALVLAAVVLALVVIGSVATVPPDRVSGGPALPPPTAAADPYRFSVDGSRRLTYQELKVELPGPPFTCTPQADPPPAGLLAQLSCAAPVHLDYDAAGHDWYAAAGVGIPDETLVVDGDLRATADRVFDGLQDGLYAADDHPVVKNLKGTRLSDVAPAGAAYAVYADVQVSRAGLKTKQDRLLVIVVRLAGGQHVFYFSDRPTDAGADVATALRTTLASVSARG